MFKRSLCTGLLTIVSFISCIANADEKVTIFAAASLTNAISEIAAEYEKMQQANIHTSFAASSTLAKQIEKGAPAEIFISADTKWMNYLQDKNLIKEGSKVNLLGNQLVLIAPKDKVFKADMDKSFNLAAAFSGRLCTGEMESVPVGIYAKQSLKSLNWWDSIKMRIVGTQDVRAALVFVERAECAAGIVYATDAKVSTKVEKVGVFPESTHEPIVYPLALLNNARPQAMVFYDYLRSEKAQTIFAKYGFYTNLPR